MGENPRFFGWETVLAQAQVRSHLVQLLVLLLIDFCQTLLALLVVQRQSLLVLKHLLLGLDFAHHVVKGLAGRDHNEAAANTSLPVHFLRRGGTLELTWSLILCLMMSSSCRVVSSVTTGARNKQVELDFQRDVLSYALQSDSGKEAEEEWRT